MSGDWIPGVAVAVTGSVLVWWRATSVASAVVDVKLSALDKEYRTLGDELKDVTQELREVITDLKSMSREQGVINTVNTKTLEAVCNKLDAHAREITDLKTSTGLIRELIMNTRAALRPGESGC